jgi:hypothetical protein
LHPVGTPLSLLLPQAERETMSKWDCIKIKSFSTVKETVTRLKIQHTEWEKIFASCSSNKRLISGIYSGQKKLSSLKINT